MEQRQAQQQVVVVALVEQEAKPQVLRVFVSELAVVAGEAGAFVVLRLFPPQHQPAFSDTFAQDCTV